MGLTTDSRVTQKSIGLTNRQWALLAKLAALEGGLRELSAVTRVVVDRGLEHPEIKKVLGQD